MSDEELLEFEIQQGEGKWIKFTYTRDGVALDLSGKTVVFGVKRNIMDTTYAYWVANDGAAWDKSEAASGILRVNLPASVTEDLAIGNYFAQAMVTLTADKDEDKSQKFILKITRPLIT